MRRREVHITKKRPRTPYLKCYHSLQNDPRPLKFFFKVPLCKQVSYEGILFKYFFNWGASRARFVTVTFFTFCKKFLIFTFSTVFGLKCLNIHLFWSSFDCLGRYFNWDNYS